MGLFKRLVIAVEKIAAREPISIEAIRATLKVVLRDQLVLDEACKIEKLQRDYEYLKSKEERSEQSLSDKEKSDIQWCEHQVALGKLKPYIKK